MLDQSAVAGANVELFVGYVPGPVEDKLVNLPDISGGQDAPIGVESRIVRKSKHPHIAQIHGAVAYVTIAAGIVVQGDHGVANEAEAFGVGVGIVAAAENVLAQLIRARGKTDGEQAARFAFVEESSEFSGLAGESCAEVLVAMQAGDAVSAAQDEDFAGVDLMPEGFDVFLAHAARPEKRNVLQAKPCELAQVPAKVAPREVLPLHLVAVLRRFGHRQKNDAFVVFTAERALDDEVIVDETAAIMRAVNERRTLHGRGVQS